MEKWRRFLFLLIFLSYSPSATRIFSPRFWYGPVRPVGSVLQ
jgi:hypothetical protein